MSKGTKEQYREDFITKLEELDKSLYQLLVAYENLDGEDNEMTADKYPFGNSFEDFYCEYYEWMNTVRFKWFNHYKPTVTVGQMIDLLTKVPRETQVTIYDKNYWFWNINEIDLPNEDDGIFTVVLRSETNFLTTQI